MLIAIVGGSSPSFLLCDFNLKLKCDTDNDLTAFFVSVGMTVTLYTFLRQRLPRSAKNGL